MDIVIKSFRRPFYLDRLLFSIYKHCRNFDKILISDGGTDEKYIEKLSKKYPNIIWDKTTTYGVKIDNKKYIEEKITTDTNKLELWRNTVKKTSSDFFLLMEDDCWITEAIDLKRTALYLSYYNAAFCKLWYAKPSDQRYSMSSTLLSNYSHKSVPDILEYRPLLTNINSLYNYFIMAQCIFKKDYYLAATKNIYVEDETAQLLNAYKFLYAKEGSVPRCFQTLNRVAYQGWAVSIRSDDIFLLETGFSGFNISDIISRAWFDDEFNPYENFPFDFNASYIINFLKENKFPKKVLDMYKKWRLGSLINSNDNLI